MFKFARGTWTRNLDNRRLPCYKLSQYAPIPGPGTRARRRLILVRPTRLILVRPTRLILPPNPFDTGPPNPIAEGATGDAEDAGLDSSKWEAGLGGWAWCQTGLGEGSFSF